MLSMRVILYFVIVVLLSGCVTFNYGAAYTEPPLRGDAATLIIYRHDTSTLAPAGKAPLPYEIDGVLAEETLNPHSYKVLTVAPGKKTLNAKTGLIDLRREAIFEAGRLYYVKASCYYVVTEAFCKIEPVPDSTGKNDVTLLRESQGNSSR